MAAATLMYGRKYQKGLNVVTTLAMVVFHAGAVAALFFTDSGAMFSALTLYCVAGMLGIGMGYHRLLTHRGYKTYKWCEYALAWCGTQNHGSAPSVLASSTMRSTGTPLAVV